MLTPEKYECKVFTSNYQGQEKGPHFGDSRNVRCLNLVTSSATPACATDGSRLDDTSPSRYPPPRRRETSLLGAAIVPPVPRNRSDRLVAGSDRAARMVGRAKAASGATHDPAASAARQRIGHAGRAIAHRTARRPQPHHRRRRSRRRHQGCATCWAATVDLNRRPYYSAAACVRTAAVNGVAPQCQDSWQTRESLRQPA
jgi:hypothetical protein